MQRGFGSVMATSDKKDWHDHVAAISNAVQAVAVMLGVGFAINELRNKDLTLLQSQIAQNRIQSNNIVESIIASLDPAIQVLSDHHSDREQFFDRSFVEMVDRDKQSASTFHVRVSV